MKRIILLELCLLFLATTFQGDRLTGWVQQTIPTNAPVVDLQFLDSLTGFIVSSKSSPDSAFIFKTTDGGNNWTNVVKDKLILTSIHFPSSQTGYCAGYSITNSQPVVLKTINSGESWSYILSINTGILYDVNFVNNDTGWVCSSSGFVGGVFRTTNGGISWQMQMNYVPSPSKVFFVNSTTGWVIGSANSGLYKTTNCGTNWILQTYISSLSDVFFASIDTGWVVGGGTGLARSTNGGMNWNVVNNPGIPVESKFFFINNVIGWIGSAPNKIFATKDGYSWGTQYSPRYSSFNVCFVDSLHGWAGYSGLVHTEDGGGTIVSVNPINSAVPKEFMLKQNYPNPFNAISKITYKISKSSEVKITVYDIMGKEVAVLLNEKKNPGEYFVTFNGNNLPSGIYFYRMIIDNQVIATKKMLMIK